MAGRLTGGGSLSLARFLDEHGEAVYYDFRATHGLNLAEIIRQLASDTLPDFTPAEVLALIEWLPDDSATAASVSGGRHYRGWGQDRWLLKSILDSTQVNGVIAMKIAAGKKANKVKIPDPWPDPERQLRIANQITPKAHVAKLRSHFG